MDVSKFFRLKKERAEQIIKQVTDAVENWRDVAKKHGISNAECASKSGAFRLPK
jgi:hypothetical protein